MAKEDIQDIFDRFSGLRIMVVGDVMIDRYLHGKVDRVSPEAPVPVVSLSKEENRPGGAANVALNLRALGVEVDLVSVVGPDTNGSIFRDLLAAEGISADLVITDHDRPTTVKTRVIAQNQHLLRVDRESVTALHPEKEQEVLQLIRKRIVGSPPDLILFQDYNKGFLTPKVIQETILEAIKGDIPTAVDPKKDNFWMYRRVTLFKPNLKEVRESVDFAVDSGQESLRQAAGHIRKRLGNHYTLITLSEKGLFFDTPEDSLIIGTRPRSIADVCGAGDTVISVASASLAAGADLQTIAELSNLAGGQVCERVGVVPVDRSALLQEYRTLVHS